MEYHIQMEKITDIIIEFKNLLSKLNLTDNQDTLNNTYQKQAFKIFTDTKEI